MLTPGQQLELEVEKPAAGGRMIARHEGQVVFVAGAIPGERVLARIDRADRQLAFGTTLDVRRPSPDRREPLADPSCAGLLYAHVSYARQLSLKSDILQDAFTRLGRIVPPPFQVAPSPERGYRMRGRLYVDGDRIGFYREGTHAVCDAAPTGLLRVEAVDAAASFATVLRREGVQAKSIVVNENIAGDERAFHVEIQPGGTIPLATLREATEQHGLTGASLRTDRGTLVAMDPAVSDPLEVLTVGRARQGALRRGSESFFQANRFLLPHLVSTVLDEIPAGGGVVDLYAGVGLFSVSLAAAGWSGITAVEGDRSSARDLRDNAAQFAGSVEVVLASVEEFLSKGGGRGVETLIVDPPRTGISRAAMNAVARSGASRIVYVSCDPPTMARDARRAVDAGYALQSLRGFDLFPNTPHVESVGVFVRV